MHTRSIVELMFVCCPVVFAFLISCVDVLLLPPQGKFTAAQKKELFQLVARNNTVRTDVISKLGILERQEAAWKDPDYNYVWEGERHTETARERNVSKLCSAKPSGEIQKRERER